MDGEFINILLWVGAGVILLLLIMRRRRRKNKEFED